MWQQGALGSRAAWQNEMLPSWINICPCPWLIFLNSGKKSNQLGLCLLTYEKKDDLHSLRKNGIWNWEGESDSRAIIYFTILCNVKKKKKVMSFGPAWSNWDFYMESLWTQFIFSCHVLQCSNAKMSCVELMW